jgi:hypothetical protein
MAVVIHSSWSKSMAHAAPERNPFMLMLNPEVVLAAVEKSERLSQLNRHLCRPLDRPAPAASGRQRDAQIVEEDDQEDDGAPATDAR